MEYLHDLDRCVKSIYEVKQCTCLPKPPTKVFNALPCIVSNMSYNEDRVNSEPSSLEPQNFIFIPHMKFPHSKKDNFTSISSIPAT